MRALVLEEIGRLEEQRHTLPEPTTGLALLRVIVTGICGSDVHGYTGETGRRFPGQIMGHESAARFVRVAAGDPDSGFQAGEVVTFNPVVVPDALDGFAGREQHHPERLVIGVEPTWSAGFADYVLVPTRNVVSLAQVIDPTLGALVEPLAVALHAVRRALVAGDERALVVGGGPIGQSVVVALKREGIHSILVSELDPARRALCQQLGASTIDPAAASIGESMSAWGGAVSLAVDAVGTTASVRAAIEGTELGGRISLVGMGSPEIALPAYGISTGERTLIGSFTYSRADFEDAARCVVEQASSLAPLVSHEVPPEEADKWFGKLARGEGPAGKVLVRFGDDDQ